MNLLKFFDKSIFKIIYYAFNHFLLYFKFLMAIIYKFTF